MYGALFGKEWIKLRWWLRLLVAASLLLLGKLFLDVRESFEFNDANALWNAVVHRKIVFYSGLDWILPVAGALIAAMQFLPEVRNRRLRLLFHLPVAGDRALGFMVLVGLGFTAGIGLLVLGGLAAIVADRYPREVVASAALTSLPWILAGLVAYSGTVLVLLEPTWWRKVAFGAVAAGLLTVYFRGRGYEAAVGAIPAFAVLALLLPGTVFLPAFRFKRGRR